jgi:Short C-terminal domain
MKSKVVVLATGGLVALMLLSRYFVLRRSGMPLAWMLYLGLPITAAGVLFALALINLGSGWTTKVQVPKCSGTLQAPLLDAAVGPSLSQRLKELGELHARGAITDTEYSARRLRIISDA